MTPLIRRLRPHQWAKNLLILLPDLAAHRSLGSELLTSPEAPIWRWLEPAPVQRLWDRHQAGEEDHGHQLWALLTLSTWLRARD